MSRTNISSRALLAIGFFTCALPLLAQKGPDQELGFRPEKLYDFTDIDTVNLFNGNLMLTVPIGPRYRVSSNLSYQFTLVYNGKVWDYESYDCLQGWQETTCTDSIPNRRSNAGLGWRLSFGRLLPPLDLSIVHSTDTRDKWIYEDPTGGEHPFLDGPVGISYDTSSLRLVLVDVNTRDVQFPNGERHRFAFENNDWRIKSMYDRFGNTVNFTYTYNGSKVAGLAVTDSVGRSHSVSFSDWSASMGEGVDRGQMVQSVNLQGVGGEIAAYSFTYDALSVRVGRYGDLTRLTVPMLSRVLQPDNADYLFAYYLDPVNDDGSQGALATMKLPTGGTTRYEYQYYMFAAYETCGNSVWGGPAGFSGPPTPNDIVGIRRRTISDGEKTAVWDYVQRRGRPAPADYPDPNGDYCCVGGNSHPLDGPFYWSRTSVLSPAVVDENSVTTRTRTDHYFDILSFRFDRDGCPYPNPQGDPRLLDPFASDGIGTFGNPGAIAVPPPTTAKGSVVGVPEDAPGYPADISAMDSGGRFLTTQVYTGCDMAGDCTTGTLARSTYTSYEFHPLAKNGWCSGYPYVCGFGINGLQLKATRTLFNDDQGCGGTCWIDTIYSDNNGAGLYRTATQSSNFPNATTTTSYTGYATWTSADVTNAAKAWITGLYTQTTRTRDVSVKQAQFCFDSNTGFLTRQRVLAGAAPATNDVLNVYSPNAQGDVQFAMSYGGEQQPLPIASDMCGVALPEPWYKIENSYQDVDGHYTGGVLSASRYYDRSTRQPFTFKVFDRTIDLSTGVATKSRDVSQVETSYDYDAVPVRLRSVTTPTGAVTTYTYTNATGRADDSSLNVAKIDVETVSSAGRLKSQFVFDGLGRVIQRSSLGPDLSWAATETTYDAEGRVFTVSEPESTGSGPPTGSLQALYKTTNRYDGLGRVRLVTAPDGSQTTVTYAGERTRTRTSGIWTGGPQDRPVPVTESYDGFGRLVKVTEQSGPTSSTSVVGSLMDTTYTYDADNHLISVKMGASPVQNRIFDYDGRSFLRWESQPESGMSSYQYDAKGHPISKTQSAANSLFDLQYTYDGAERLIRLDGRNPFYNPSDPFQPAFRPVKEFTFADQNNGADLRMGKLETAVRHNYGISTSEPEFSVAESYQYLDVAGRMTDRTTTVSQSTGGVGGTAQTLQTITMSVSRDALDNVSVMKYPMCVGCGTPPTDPDRSLMTRTYSANRLKSLSHYISSITYWPNGMRNVITHLNGIADTQTVNNMPRPSSLKFELYDRCVHPSFTSQPSGGQVTTPGDPFVLTALVTGTGTLSYEWINASTNQSIGTTPSITVNPTSDTSYYLIATNPCGYEVSETARVTVAQCVTPSTGQIRAVAQPDGSWILKPNPTARQPRTYSWLRLPDNLLVGTQETVAIGALSTTTTYRLTITDACGSASGDVTISVPLPVTTGLQAAWDFRSPNQVSVSWPPIAGATQYSVERRSGATWQAIATTQAAGYIDPSVVSGQTYAYHVRSNNGGSTDVDIATTMSFNEALSRQVVTATPVNDMLTAVNKVRAAAGWPMLTWSNVLAANDPLPAPGALITARQIVACRARMNEALQALGVRVRDYSDPDLFHLPIKAQNINEVQQRAQ